jgi:mRNA interferase MazF
VARGQVWWADLGEAEGSEPAYRRPVLIVQADAFNRSRLRTVVAVVLTSNLRLLDAPGNVLIPAGESGLPRDSVANVTQIITLDRDFLADFAGSLASATLRALDRGLRLALSL